MILEELEIPLDRFAAGTGWTIKPEGACRDELCVPLGTEAVREGRIDVEAAAGRLGMPLLHDEAHSLWALGPGTATGRALATAKVPPLSLPDLEGKPFALESLRGQKVLLMAWASW